MAKILITIGVVCILAGLAWPLLKNIPLGRLPGDITVIRENFRIHFPLTTCILISLVLSFILWFFRK